jgi:hypothetical protein
VPPARRLLKKIRDFRPFFQRLRARGKPYRVVLVAVMRKLLVHLNAVVAAQDRAEPLPLEKTGQNQLA